MEKITHTFKDGDVLYANQLNPIVNAVNDNADQIADLRGMTIENVQTGTIEAQSNHYYNVAEDVDTLAVTLPTITPGKTSVVKVHFIAGTAPVMAINGGDVRVICSMNHIVAHDEYVLTMTYDGFAWLVTAEVLTPNDCLVFQSQSAFELTFVKKQWDGILQYSTNGTTWQDVELNGAMQSADDGMRHILMLRGLGNKQFGDSNDTPVLTMTGENIDCIGNIMTLLDYLRPGLELQEYAFAKFFSGCQPLRSAPGLPATTLAMACYTNMFSYCTSLKEAPALPAKKVFSQSYAAMFYGCTALEQAPELPATSLAQYCYAYMFYDCTSLLTAPSLPGTSLQSSCYAYMFSGCTSLNEITLLATNVSASNCLTDWVNNVAASGIFTKKTNTSLPTGDSGIPDGWEVVNV